MFRLLYNFWKEYSIFRSQLDDGVNPAQSLQNLQKQHADDVTRKKMLIERRRLSKLINEKKKKREYIPKERSKPADLIRWAIIIIIIIIIKYSMLFLIDTFLNTIVYSV